MKLIAVIKKNSAELKISKFSILFLKRSSPSSQKIAKAKFKPKILGQSFSKRRFISGFHSRYFAEFKVNSLKTVFNLDS